MVLLSVAVLCVSVPLTVLSIGCTSSAISSAYDAADKWIAAGTIAMSICGVAATTLAIISLCV